MEELKRLRQQYVKVQDQILEREIANDVSLINKAKESINKDACRAYVKDFFIHTGSFPLWPGPSCETIIPFVESKVSSVAKRKAVDAILKDNLVQEYDGRLTRYRVFLNEKDLF